jgi:hypothetical protein
MLRWYADLKELRAVPVECAEGGYPHRDANGKIQYENSHFDSKGEADACVLKDLEAKLHFELIELRDAEKALRTSKEHVVATLKGIQQALEEASGSGKTLMDVVKGAMK